MALASGYREPAATVNGRKRALLGIALGVVAVLLLIVAAAFTWSGVTLASDASALARVSVQPLGGTIEHVSAVTAGGHAVPLRVSGGRLTPLRRLTPGEQVSVVVQVRRPGWLGWALGSQRTEHLTLRAPVAQVKEQWMTVRPGSHVRVSFDEPVSAVAYMGGGGLTHHVAGHGQSTVSLGAQPQTGAVEIAAAARPWERIGKPILVSWFPPSHSPVMVTLPAAGARISPATPLHLTFSKPVSDVLGSHRPRISPSTPGRWAQPNSHTLVFTPSGLGAPLDSALHLTLARRVAVTAGSGGGLNTTNAVSWTVPSGSTLRLQQLLAQAGYLPVDWRPAGTPMPRTAAAEAQAAVTPPQGSFSWRYGNTPQALEAMWTPGQANTITRGAVMKFEDEHAMTVDGVAGPALWRTLMSSALAGQHQGNGQGGGYTYVFVRRAVPETLALWHDGRTVITSPANTGISGAETELGTFPVFEHIPEGTMSGTNPDGSHYQDPGIKWISYFNGGDALHNFNRASFGTPQSLGCVELPLATSAAVYPYTPIGTLVTVSA